MGIKTEMNKELKLAASRIRESSYVAKLVAKTNASARDIGKAAPIVAKITADINVSWTEFGKHAPSIMEKILNNIPAWAKKQSTVNNERRRI